jgi:hypothetical protein
VQAEAQLDDLVGEIAAGAAETATKAAKVQHRALL